VPSAFQELGEIPEGRRLHDHRHPNPRRSGATAATGALARRSTVLHGVIAKAEAADGVPSISASDLETLKTTFENAGIDFIVMTGLNLRLGSLRDEDG
jgi:hypothetical protein